jgi:signal transduction histidine kinase
VHVRRAGSKIVAIVQDDGQGFDPKRLPGRTITARGVGLLGMRERVASLGGTLQIESRPGQGTAISAEIPLDDAPAESEL